MVPTKWPSEKNTGFAGTGVAQAHHRQPHLCSEVGLMFSIVEENRQLEPIQLQTKMETTGAH